MDHKRKRRGYTLLMLVLMLALLFGSVYDYAVRNGQWIKDNIYATMGEAAQQQLMLFQTKLGDQFSQLRILADEVDPSESEANEKLQYAMDRSAEEYHFFGLGLISAADGVAHMNTGESFDASQREYYLRALKGESSIEFAEQGRMTGVPVLVLAVPVYQGDSVAAVLFASHDTSGFAELLATMAFDGRSYSYITNANGRIIVDPNHASALVSGGNALDFFGDAELEGGLTRADIASHMQAGDPFTFSVTSGPEKRYATVIPVGVNNWSLFYVTTDAVVAEQIAASASIVYSLSIKLLVIFILFMTMTLLREKRIRRGIALQEEEFRIAASQSNKTIMRYDIQKKTAFYAPGHTPKGVVRRTLSQGVPDSVVAAGLVAKESVEDYLAFYAAMRRGEHTGAMVCRMQTSTGDFAWFHADYTLVGGDDPPRFAIVTFCDVTRQREQESIYEKWRQSLRDRKPDSYTLFHCNVDRDNTVDSREGSLLTIRFKPESLGFNSHTAQYASEYVAAEDRERFSAFLNIDTLLENGRRGNRVVSMEYREALPQGGSRWLRLSVDLIELANSAEMEVYLLFEDIDEEKRAELALLERAETDPLTGLLNRAAFAQRVEALIDKSGRDGRHALLMLDVDDFKQVNDAFGHGTGDQVLADFGALLSQCLRRSDLVGRLGGDEFVAFLPDISKNAAQRKARQICDLSNKSLSAQVRISASIGVALYPGDGNDFEALYKKADDALYHVKGQGKNGYAFYRDDMTLEKPEEP